MKGIPAARISPLAQNMLGLLTRLGAIGSGMPSMVDLSYSLQCSTTSCDRVLGELERAGAMQCLSRGTGRVRGSWRLVGSDGGGGAVLDGTKPVLSEDGEGPKERRCLKGNHLFLSAHKGNRICEACRSLTAVEGDAGSFPLALPQSGQLKRPLIRQTFV